MPPASSAPLEKKLLLKPGMQALVVGAPEGFAIAPPSDGVLHTEATGKVYDFLLAFAKDRKDAKRHAKLLKLVGGGSIVWFAWPKKSAAIASDLTRDEGWEPLWERGWEGIATVSIDATWSGMRFRPSEKVNAVGTKRARPSTGKRR